MDQARESVGRTWTGWARQSSMSFCPAEAGRSATAVRAGGLVAATSSTFGAATLATTSSGSDQLGEARRQFGVGEGAPAREKPTVHRPKTLVSVQNSGGLGGPGRPASVAMHRLFQVLVAGHAGHRLCAKWIVLDRDGHVMPGGENLLNLPFDSPAIRALVVGQHHDPQRAGLRSNAVATRETAASRRARRAARIRGTARVRRLRLS